MHVFYENLPPDDAAEIEQLSRLMYEIRSARDTRLAELGAADPEQALARIAAGTYGQCMDCGADIAPQRLQAAPEAARCIDCQARAEHH